MNNYRLQRDGDSFKNIALYWSSAMKCFDETGIIIDESMCNSIESINKITYDHS